MKAVVSSFVAVLTGLVLFGSQASALTGSPYPSGQNGVDVSWPNCGASISSTLPFGIVGVSGGLAYDAGNSCLSAETSHFSNLSLYANTGLNVDTATANSYYNQAYARANCAVAANPSTCGAYYYGYYAGQNIVAYAQQKNVHSQYWWLDVETVNTWNADTNLNTQSLQGEHDGLLAALQANGLTATVGAYSTTYQWGKIAGSFKPGWPVWYATSLRNTKSVPGYCTASNAFTGGQVQLVQWRSKLDQDYAC